MKQDASVLWQTHQSMKRSEHTERERKKGLLRAVKVSKVHLSGCAREMRMIKFQIRRQTLNRAPATVIANQRVSTTECSTRPPHSPNNTGSRRVWPIAVGWCSARMHPHTAMTRRMSRSSVMRELCPHFKGNEPSNGHSQNNSVHCLHQTLCSLVLHARHDWHPLLSFFNFALCPTLSPLISVRLESTLLLNHSIISNDSGHQTTFCCWRQWVCWLASLPRSHTVGMESHVALSTWSSCLTSVSTMVSQGELDHWRRE